MNIVKGSIQSVDQQGSVLYRLSQKMSCSYGVSILFRTFRYEIETTRNIKFTMENFRDVFPDWENGEPYCKKKIEGSVEVSNYENSQQRIFSDFSHQCAQVSYEEVGVYLDVFWQEIAAHFTLPPTYVYLHNPAIGSVFNCGIFWQFCYIYLNNETKQGIVIAADATD